MKRNEKKRGRRERCVQQKLDFGKGRWGGRRKGAGRRKSKNSGVSHSKREEFLESEPVHVTMKLKEGLPNLREGEDFLCLGKKLQEGQKDDFRIVHFSVQSNHVHLLVEAAGKDALHRGMRGLTVRVGKALKKRWELEDSVFADRYHARILRKPTEVRNALRYVLNNHLRHYPGAKRGIPDPRSSSALFDGWKEVEAAVLEGELRPIVAARSWLIRRGWKRAGGKLSLFEVPGSKRRSGS